jgi:hypothetical protein
MAGGLAGVADPRGFEQGNAAVAVRDGLMLGALGDDEDVASGEVDIGAVLKSDGEAATAPPATNAMAKVRARKLMASAPRCKITRVHG